MGLSYFIQPVHPLDKPYARSIEEDRRSVILANELGYKEAFVGEHFTNLAEAITSCLMFLVWLARDTGLDLPTRPWAANPWSS